jgi:hypothetical protein
LIIKVLFGSFTLPEKIVYNSEIVDRSADPVKFCDPAFKKRYVFQKIFSLFGIVPETGLL